MRIRYCSDIHLEFNGNPLPKQFKTNSEEILLVAGDTIPGVYLQEFKNDGRSRSMKKMFAKFLDKASKFKEVYMIGGNHEHYGGIIDNSITWIKDFIKRGKTQGRWKNVHFLENEYVYLGNNVHLLACTLWTDAHKGNPMVAESISWYMNDFRGQIKKLVGEDQLRNYTVLDMIDIHLNSMQFLNKMYNTIIESAEDPKIIVLTHHAPSYESGQGNPRGSTDSDAAYYSELSNWIIERPELKHWIHGHSHYNVDYMIGECNVHANQRGYGMFGYLDRCFETFNLDPCIEI